MIPIPWDPNGVTWPHEPKCETCKRFDADCDCSVTVNQMSPQSTGPLTDPHLDPNWLRATHWPMPKPPPYPADDEAKP